MGDKHEIGEKVIGDLNEIKDMAEKLSNNFYVGIIPTDKYLQVEALNILPISKLEYFLKSSGIINQQFEIKDIIKKSTVLNPLEKEHLIYFFLIRHTIAHNGGYFDDIFFEKIQKEKFKTLKIELQNYKNSSLSPILPSDIAKYIDLIKNLIREQLQ